jgi:hypothetical protein
MVDMANEPEKTPAQAPETTTPAANTPAPTPVNPPASPGTKALTGEVVPTAEELQEKKVKKAFLEKFKLVKKPNSALPTANGEVPAASADEVAENLYRQLASIKGNDYLVLRIKKKSLLVSMGLLLVLMWVMVVGKQVIEWKKPQWAIWNRNQEQTTQTPAPTGIPTASPQSLMRIRVRNNNDTLGAAQALADFLKGKGYTNIEVADDQQSDYVGIMVIVKPSNKDLQKQLTDLLKDQYTLSSPSAELTADSDFDAVILDGNPAKISPTAKPKASSASAAIRPASASAVTR